MEPLPKKQKCDKEVYENGTDIPRLTSVMKAITELQISTPTVYVGDSTIASDFWKSGSAKLVLTLISHHLSIDAIPIVSRVCKLWNEIMQQSSVWLNLFQNHFGLRAKKASDWKIEFQRVYQNTKQICMEGGNYSRYVPVYMALMRRSFVFYSNDCRESFVAPSLVSV